jgi:hypothetical protein
MARTFKDQPEQVISIKRKKKEVCTKDFLRSKNPRMAKHDSSSDEDICLRCGENLEYVNGVPFCDSCGWSTVEDVVDEMDRNDAA